jgi:SAM-dependent methyltransferase
VKSYSSRIGIVENLREGRVLFNMHRRAQGRMRELVGDVRNVEAEIKTRLGADIKGLDVLEVGPGQFLAQASYFAMANRVVGLDSDIIVRGFDPRAYVRMVLRNGLTRTAKTVARKLTGVDRRFRRELRQELGVTSLPRIEVQLGDIRSLRFRDSSFDFVYCRSVLHQLSSPSLAIAEIARVLRPGGISYVSVHPWTSETGCLDPRLYGPKAPEVMGWPHLDPVRNAQLISPNVELNHLRIGDWEGIFLEKMPGAQFILTPASDPGCLERARDFQRRYGEQLDYKLEELTSGAFACLWKKP